MSSTQNSVRSSLDAIFEADRALLRAERQLLDGNPSEVLVSAVAEAKQLDDREEAQMRLARLADLCAQVDGTPMIEALLDILDDEDPQVRVAAGEALRDVAYDYYGDVARVIERHLSQERQGLAMAELPFILVEIGDESLPKLLKRFLRHSSADVVAAAIEAAVESVEPAVVPELQKLTDDERDVTIADFESETEATVGALAAEALTFFERLEDLDAETGDEVMSKSRG